MDLWPKQIGTVAGSKLHGKLAAHSGAVCLKDGAICLFWRGSPALMLLWLYDQMTLFTRSGNSNWHTLQLLSPTSHHRWSAAAARDSMLPSGHMSQLVQLQLQMPVSLLSSWNTQTLHRRVQGCVGGDGHKLPVPVEHLNHPAPSMSVLAWSCLFNWCHWFWLWGEWQESYRQWQYNGIT